MKATHGRLLRLIGWVALGHVVVIAALSPAWYWGDADSPEALLQRGEEALAAGQHAQAMELFRKVMDRQPKPPPVYVKAAEQHRLADRLARQAAGDAARTAEQAGKPVQAPTTAPMNVPAPATRDAGPFVPPELRKR